ncbi:hypothetical protein PR001_g33810 [Phytophthora rubi]|uniref:Phospholipase D-like domain-containing protein n=1 Tax=Phytophthora rubi TaxID=129364 RepID=A0A6A3G3J6_9STRA|nr:hypothetical protein PR001_g33810 [Phytophthora rubi]
MFLLTHKLLVEKLKSALAAGVEVKLIVDCLKPVERVIPPLKTSSRPERRCATAPQPSTGRLRFSTARFSSTALKTGRRVDYWGPTSSARQCSAAQL